MSRDALTGLDEHRDRIGEIELTLDVLRLEPLERRPQCVRPERVDRRVDLVDLELFGRRIRALDDTNDRPAGVSHDAAVEARIRRLRGEDRCRGLLETVRVEQCVEQLGGEQRRVAGEHEHIPRAAGERCPRRACGVTGSERLCLDGDGDGRLLELIAARRRGDDDNGLRARRDRAVDHPVDEPPPEDRVEVLRHGRAHASAEASGHDQGCERRIGHIVVASARWLGRQDSNLGSRDQNPLPYRLATPHCDSSIGAPLPAIGEEEEERDDGEERHDRDRDRLHEPERQRHAEHDQLRRSEDPAHLAHHV